MKRLTSKLKSSLKKPDFCHTGQQLNLICLLSIWHLVLAAQFLWKATEWEDEINTNPCEQALLFCYGQATHKRRCESEERGFKAIFNKFPFHPRLTIKPKIIVPETRNATASKPWPHMKVKLPLQAFHCFKTMFLSPQWFFLSISIFHIFTLRWNPLYFSKFINATTYKKGGPI